MNQSYKAIVSVVEDCVHSLLPVPGLDTVH